jgi:hypothetical protein
VDKIIDFGEHVYQVHLRPERPLSRFRPGQFLHLALDSYDPSGFWQGIGTLRDLKYLEFLWDSGNPRFRPSARPPRKDLERRSPIELYAPSTPIFFT